MKEEKNFDRPANPPPPKKKKRERSGGDSGAATAIDMTPMIDMVFNLIIFFMVITDMTQKDLEYLVLPKVAMAAEDKDADKERLIVNVVNPDLEDMKGRVDLSKPPIFFRGRQVTSLKDLRAQLYVHANPRLYPEKEKPNGEPFQPIDGKGLYPSRKPLLIRCDQGQIFGWVQAIMQYCTFVPGNPQAQEFAESPFIYKLEIAVADPNPPK